VRNLLPRTRRFRPSDASVDLLGGAALSLFLVMAVGAFFIDITNALIIQGYLTLPLLGF
jgi:Na+/glutamate symporter